MVRPQTVLILGIVVFAIVSVLLFLLASITNEAGWAVTGATVILVIATLSLGRFTEGLQNATERLAKATERSAEIDRERDRKEVRARIRERIEDKCRLAEIVLGWAPKTWLATNDKGIVSFTEAFAGPQFHAVLRILGLLIRPEDEAAKYNISTLFLETFDRIDRGMKIEGVPAQSFAHNHVSVQDALQKDLPRWRAQVIDLGYQEEKEYLEGGGSPVARGRQP